MDKSAQELTKSVMSQSQNTETTKHNKVKTSHRQKVIIFCVKQSCASHSFKENIFTHLARGFVAQITLCW